MKQRLDQLLVERKLTPTRSQAESRIRLGDVSVDGVVIKKPGHFVANDAAIKLKPTVQYVSRAGQKLASVAGSLRIDFEGKTVLDVGSSTGGFTDYALKHGANHVIAVDVGTDQMHRSLRSDSRVMLLEKTDIRDLEQLPAEADIALIDVSFISLRKVLPSVSRLMKSKKPIVAMFKPQFEGGALTKTRGVVKNDTMRRSLIKEFEVWLREQGFHIVAKADSSVTGAKGNRERFYCLELTKAI